MPNDNLILLCHNEARVFFRHATEKIIKIFKLLSNYIDGFHQKKSKRLSKVNIFPKPHSFLAISSLNTPGKEM